METGFFSQNNIGSDILLTEMFEDSDKYVYFIEDRNTQEWLTDARKWTKKQTFTYKIETVPDNGHLHIEVTPRGEDPRWADENQIFEGDEYKIEWKMNDDIHIAIDEMTHECSWGKKPSDKKVLKGQVLSSIDVCS